MKQTAVETLIEIYYGNEGQLTIKDLDQAKAMEKEQIVTTWNTAHQAGRFEGKGIAEKDWQTFETYWEETFKSE
jgi:hypothetical protein